MFVRKFDDLLCKITLCILQISVSKYLDCDAIGLQLIFREATLHYKVAVPNKAQLLNRPTILIFFSGANKNSILSLTKS